MMTQSEMQHARRALMYWKKQLALANLNEAMKPATEQKMKDLAAKFADKFGMTIKMAVAAGFNPRGEDGSFDTAQAIKATVRKYKNDKMFIDMIFDGDKRQLTNLTKTTEQFNLFANEVFMIWKKDPVIKKFLGQKGADAADELGLDPMDDNTETLPEDEDVEVKEDEVINKQSRRQKKPAHNLHQDGEEEDEVMQRFNPHNGHEGDQSIAIKEMEPPIAEEECDECDALDDSQVTCEDVAEYIQQECDKNKLNNVPIVMKESDGTYKYINNIRFYNGHCVIES